MNTSEIALSHALASANWSWTAEAEAKLQTYVAGEAARAGRTSSSYRDRQWRANLPSRIRRSPKRSAALVGGAQ